MKQFLVLLLFVLVIGMNSCKKDAVDPAICSQVWATEVVDELNAVSAAANAYASNPNHETCVAYKDAYQDYLDALKPFLKCTSYTPQQKAELQDAIDQAEADIETLCDE